MKKDITYTEAAERLEQIVHQIEHDMPDVDELTKLVGEAVELTKFCRRKLTVADKQLTELMAQLSNNTQEIEI